MFVFSSFLYFCFVYFAYLFVYFSPFFCLFVYFIYFIVCFFPLSFMSCFFYLFIVFVCLFFFFLLFIYLFCLFVCLYVFPLCLFDYFVYLCVLFVCFIFLFVCVLPFFSFLFFSLFLNGSKLKIEKLEKMHNTSTIIKSLEIYAKYYILLCDSVDIQSTVKRNDLFVKLLQTEPYLPKHDLFATQYLHR